MRSCGSRPLRLPDPFLYSPNPSPDGEPDAADRLRRSGPTCRMAADEGRGAPGGAGAVGRRARGRWTDGQEPSRQARVAHDPRPPPLPAAPVRVAGARAAHRRSSATRTSRSRGRSSRSRSGASRPAEDADGRGSRTAAGRSRHVVQPAVARRQLQPGTHVRLRGKPGALRLRRPLLRPGTASSRQPTSRRSTPRARR